MSLFTCNPRPVKKNTNRLLFAFLFAMLATLSQNVLAQTPYDVTGGGTYCIGTGGVSIGLNSSDVGVSYQLLLGNTPVGSPVSGTGSAISFGSHTTPGAYTVEGTDAANSTSAFMTGTAYVSASPLPVLTATSQCVGGTLTLSGVSYGDNIVWKRNGTTISSYNAGWSANATSYAQNQVQEANNVFIAPNGDMYIADGTLSAVLKFSAGFTPNSVGTVVAGNTISGPGSDSDQLDYPTSVFVDAAGYIYVADHYNNRVQKFPPNSTEGTKAVTVAATDLDGPFDIKLDASGNLYVANLYSGSVMEYASGSDENTSGNPIAYVGYPQGIAVDGAGNVYVSDASAAEVRKYPADVVVAGGNGDGDAADQLNTPASLYIDATGRLYVVDQGNSRVQMFPANSTSSSSAVTVAGVGGAGNNANQLDYPFSLAFDAQQNLYVADYSNARIQKFALNNTYTPTQAGTITATVSNSYGCVATDTIEMAGSPTIYAVSGGGRICAGEAGVAVGLSNSEVGVNYQLKLGNTNIGSVVAGTGSAISFGLQNVAGNYTVTGASAIGGCANAMSGSASVVVGTAPVAEIVTTGICAGRTLTLAGLENQGISKIIWKKDGVSVDTTYAFIDTSAVTIGNASGPVGVIVDRDTVYALGWFDGSVKKWTPGSSTAVNVAGSGSLQFAGGIARDASGNIYVSDYFNNRVTKWAPGSPVGIVVAGDNGNGGAADQLAAPGGVYVDGQGNVFVADRENHRIQKWAPNATTGITVAGGNGSGSGANQLSYPSGVFVDATGNIYVADSANHRVQKWGNNATTGTTVAGGNGAGSAANQLKMPTGVFVDAWGNIYVADFGNHRIQKWAANAIAGVTVAGKTTNGTSSTQLNSPISVWVDKGNIYVADLANSRIQKFASQIDSVYNTGAGGGAYSAYLESFDGCSATSGNTNVPVMPTATAAATAADCHGTATGDVVLTVINGASPITYSWSNGATTKDLANVAAGTYTVVATDGNGCTANASATVTQPAAIATTFVNGNVSCAGGTNGAVTTTVTGGVAPYTYSWSNGATTKDLSGLSAGSYTITVTDANNCTKVSSVTVTQPQVLTSSAVASDVTCFGGSNGALNLTVSNGTPPYTYSWSNGMTTEDISNLSANTYSVSISDANGCSTSGAYVVSQSPNALTYDITTTNTSCSNPNGGAIVIGNVTGGTAPYAYSINNGTFGSTTSFTGLSTNVYKITVRDNVNCAVSKEVGVIKSFCSVAKNDTFTSCINTPVNFTLAQLIGNDSIVAGENVAIGNWDDPAVGSLTYNSTTKVFTYTPATNYSGPVTFTYTIKKDDSTFFWGGTNHFYEFRPNLSSWFFARDSARLFVKNGMRGYLATVTSAAENEFIRTRLKGDGWMGASDRAYEGVWRWVTGPEGLEDGGQGRHFSGQNKTNTCLAITGPSYNGNYHKWDLNEPNDCGVAVPTPYSPTDISRFGEHAAYFITTKNGTWNDYNPSVQLPGYVIEYGGMESAALPVIGSTATVILNIDAPTVYNVTGGGAYCLGDAGVSIGLSGSQVGVNYQLKNGALNVGSPVAGTGSAISFGNQLAVGNYTVTATKVATSCVLNMSGSATVVVNPLPTVYNVNGGGTICPGTGAPITITGSDTGVVYQVKLAGLNIGSPIAGTGLSLNLSAIPLTVTGIYSVVATNVTTGCTQAMSGTAIISLSATPTAYNVTGGGQYCVGGNGVTVGLANSDLLVSYQLKRGTTNVGSPISGLGGSINFGLQTVPGTYTVVATNLIGCSNTMAGNATVATVTPPTAFSVIGGGAYCAGGSGVSIGLAGSQNGVNYQLKNLGVNVGAPVAGTGLPISFGTHSAIGNYTVVATNTTYGCTANMSGVALVMVYPLPYATGIQNNITCFGAGNGAINVTTTLGTSPYSYIWSNGATTEDINGLSAGTYTLTVSDANGCSVNLSKNITEPSAITATSTQSISTMSNGAINITVTGGTVPYTYLWSNGATTEDVSGLAPGMYSVVITDANGCTKTINFNLINPLSVTGVTGNVNCFGAGTGNINITVNGGIAPYTFLWNDNVTTEDRNGIIAGNYSVLITDANGDTTSGSWTLTQPATAVSVTGVVTNVTCAFANGAVDITATGGTAPYTYLWNGGATTEDRNSLAAGYYTVTVTDSSGCTATGTYTIISNDTVAPVITGPTSGSSVTANPLLPALGFHVFVRNNMTVGNSQTHGSMAMGGNLTLSGNYGVSNNSAGSFTVGGKTVSLVVGGQVNYGSGGMNVNQNGYVKIGSCGSSVVWYTDQNGAYSPIRITPGSNYNGSPRINLQANAQNLGVSASNNPVCQANVIDFATAFTQLQSSATSMSAMTTNANLTNPNGNPIATTNLPNQVKINLSNGVNVLNINASDLNAVQVFTYNQQPSASRIMVFNVNAPGTFNWNVWNSSGIGDANSPYIIYNFYNTTTLNVNSGSAVMGTLFAPFADINKTSNSSNISGQVVGQSFNHTAGTNVLAHFNATLTTGTTTVIAANSNNTRYTASNTCTYAVNGNEFTPTAADNCANASLSYTLTGATTGTGTNLAGVLLNKGTTNVLWTATDGINTSTYGFNVTVLDTVKPVVATQNITVSLNQNGVATVIPAAINNGSTDNCGIATYALSQTTFTTGNIGNNNVILTVTDVNGNVSTGTAVVTVNAALNINGTVTHVGIFGQSTGAVNATVTGGVGPYTYSWSNGATTEDLSGVPAGTYVITVTDANGATAKDTFIVNQPAQLLATANVTHVTINGQSTGGVNITVTGGVGPYTYSWSNGATTEDLSGVPAGSYTVTVTDANGATYTNTYVVNQPAALLVSGVVTHVVIFGQSTGAVNATVAGGVGPYTYAWSNGATTEDINGVPAGTYVITVTDANGATAKDTFIVNQPAQLLATSNVTHVTINGQSTGGVNITVTGGVGPYTYSWSNGATTEDLSGVPAGSYTVTVTDANGATYTNTYVVNQPAALLVSGVVTHVGIFGQSTGAVNATVTGGVGPYTYSWSNGATTEDIANVPAGTYVITVTDANGAIAKDTFIVNQPAALAITGTVTNVTTNGGSNGAVNITVTGGVGPYTYAWSNGATTEDLSGVPAGSYTVTVTDANGATKTANYTVTQPTVPLSGTLTVSPVQTVSGQAPYTIYLGYGAQSVTLTAAGIGGVPGYTYSWSPSTGLANPNAAVTTAAPGTTTTYTVVITDATGATVTLSRTINVVNVKSGNKIILCHNGNELKVSVNAVPGHLNHGDYLGGCLDVDGVRSHVSCNGGNDGSINITATGGAAPYTYSWSNGATTEDLNNLSAGTYTVTVTDGAGRTTSESFTISQPSAISISGSKTNVKCYGESNGSITLNVCNGSSPYSYSWSDGSTSKNRSNLGAGTYVVTVTDANGCSKKDTFVITAPATAIAITGNKTNVKCKGDENGKIDISVSGGTGPYTYSWSNGTNTSNNNNSNWWNWWSGWCNNNSGSTYATTQNLSGLEAGTYTVTVTDANGCTKTASYTITEPASALSVSGNRSHVACNGGNNGAISVSVSGGVSPYSYKWNDNITTQNRSNLAAGNYSVEVTDANGCVKSTSFTISQPSAISISGSKTNVKCYGESNGSITLNVCNGSSPYSYSWSDGSTSKNRSNLGAGTYVVTVTDANGCSKKDTFVITAPASAIAITGNKTNVKCKGEDDGAIDITVIGGVGPYTYSWSDDNDGGSHSGHHHGQSGNHRGHRCHHGNTTNTQDIDDLEAGTYTVTVTDANGCTKTASYTITEPASALSVSGTVSNVSCGNNCNGGITLSVSGGTAPYTYKWNNNSTVKDRSNLCTGSYSVVVTDANGCTKSANFTVGQSQSNMNVSINVNPSPTVSGQQPRTIYLGYGAQSVTLNASASNGGGGYSYSWWPTTGLSNANSASPVASPTSTRTYTVTVTDANGCTKSSSVTITVIDVRDGNKILVCKNGDTRKINSNQVSSYLNSGYTLGECDRDCGNKGISEEEVVTMRELVLYPNPTQGVFYVQLPEAVKGGEAVIMDMNGKVIERKHFMPDTKLSFDLSYVPKGVYMVQIANGGDVYKAKVTIQE